MAFIRLKKIKSKHYAYLVENKWVDGRAKQKVTQYLGPVIKREDTAIPSIPEDAHPQHILSLLITEETRHVPDIKITKTTVRKKKKAVTIELNGGFLCDYTLRQIQKALNAKDEETPGTALANAFAQAGLRIPQHAFITLYTSHR